MPASIRFHRIDATEQDDAISVFNERRQLVSDQVTTASWKADQVLSVSGNAQAPHNGNAPELPSLDVFDADRSGRFDTAAQARQYAAHQLDALRVAARTFHGQGAVRTLEAGKRYTLTQHPDLSGQAFVPLTIDHIATNNLGTQLPHLRGSAADDSAMGKGSYRQQFDLADQSVTVTSTTDRIDVLAKNKIVLQSGQSIITLEGQNITIACPGNFTVKSGTHDWLGGEGQAAELPALPVGEAATGTLYLDHRYHDDQGLAGAQYFATFLDGSTKQGVLDGQGRAVVSGVPIGGAEVSFSPMPKVFERKDKTPTPGYTPAPSDAKLRELVAKYQPASSGDDCATS